MLKPPVKTATQSSILAMQPEEGKQDIYDEALADINRLVEEVEALSRKRSRSVTSPTSKPAKHRRFREVPGDAGAGSIEERMEIDEHNDTAMNVDEAQAPEDHMDIWSEDAFAQLAGVLGVTEETEETEEIEEIEETGETEETEEIEEAEETEEVLNLPVLRDSVYTCVEAVGARRSGMRRILSLAYLIALEDDVQFASGLYRSGSRPHHGE